MSVICIAVSTSRISVADPHHLDADPDPAFHFNADQDPSFQIKAQKLGRSAQIGLYTYILSSHLQFYSDPDADPDLAYHFDADPDPTFQFDANPWGSGSKPLSRRIGS